MAFIAPIMSALGFISESKPAQEAIGTVYHDTGYAGRTFMRTSEKMFIATIIVFCLILIFVGVILLAYEQWRWGFIIGGAGVGALLGARHWWNNSVVGELVNEPNAAGKDELTTEPVEGAEEWDSEYFEDTYHDLVQGSHEKGILTNLHKLIDSLEGHSEGEGAATLADIRQSIEKKAEKSDHNLKDTLELIENTLAKSEEVKDAYQKMTEDEKSEFKEALELLEKSAREAGSKSLELEGKIGELSQVFA